MDLMDGRYGGNDAIFKRFDILNGRHKGQSIEKGNDWELKKQVW